MELKAATESDFQEIMRLINQAKAHLKKLNIDQWQDGYPNEDIIKKDINAKNAYVLTDKEKVIGYVCIAFGEDETYATIEGQWKSDQPYAVIHRMAIDDAFKGQGLSAHMFAFAEKLCKIKDIHSIKVDTHEKNLVMRHLITKNGYEYCGIVRFRNCERIAFEKLLV